MGSSGKVVGLIAENRAFSPCGAGAAAAEPCREDAVILRSDAGMVRFRVELADDAAERRRA